VAALGVSGREVLSAILRRYCMGEKGVERKGSVSKPPGGGRSASSLRF